MVLFRSELIAEIKPDWGKFRFRIGSVFAKYRFLAHLLCSISPEPSPKFSAIEHRVSRQTKVFMVRHNNSRKIARNISPWRCAEILIGYNGEFRMRASKRQFSAGSVILCANSTTRASLAPPTRLVSWLCALIIYHSHSADSEHKIYLLSIPQSRSLQQPKSKAKSHKLWPSSQRYWKRKETTPYQVVWNTMRMYLESEWNIVVIPRGKVNAHHPSENFILGNRAAIVTMAKTIHTIAYPHIIKPTKIPTPCNTVAKEGEM